MSSNTMEPPLKKPKLERISVHGIDGTTKTLLKYTLHPDLADGLEKMIMIFKERQQILVQLVIAILKDPQGTELVQDISDLKVPDGTKKAFIAIIGESGTGKSSLMNALLGDKIAPTSLGNSCTTTATMFHYTEPGMQRYVAKIALMDWAEAEEETNKNCGYIRQMHEELERLKAKKSKTDSSEVEEEDYVDVEALTDNFEIAKGSLGALLPDFEFEGEGFKLEDLRLIPLRIKQLYEKDARLSSAKLEITSDDKEEFKDKVQNLLRNKTSYDPSKPSETQLWPLVKGVQIYMDSELLKYGIILVDLPGSNDDNAARSNMARQYLHMVDETIVAAAYTRILCNPNLEPIALLGLRGQTEFDGTRRLIVACTKIDMLNELEEPELINELCSIFPDFEAKIQDLKGQRAEYNKKKDEDMVEEVEEIIGNLSLTTRDEQIPIAVSSRFKNLPLLKEKNISFRVFLVSSKKFLDNLPQKKKRKSKAIKENQEEFAALNEKTQIPAMRAFLSELVKEKRALEGLEFIENFIHELYTVQNTLMAWDAKFTKDAKEKLQANVEGDVKILTEGIEKAQETALTSLEELFDSFLEDLADIKSKAGDLAVEKHDELTDRRGAGYQFYRSLCMKEGIFKDKKKGDVDLNKELMLVFIGVVAKQWKDVCSEFDKILNDHETQVVAFLKEFKASILSYDCFQQDENRSTTLTSVLDRAESSYEKNFPRKLKDLKKRLKTLINEIENSTFVKDSLKNVYKAAAGLKGKGVLQQMRETIEEGLKKGTPFTKVEEAVRETLDKTVSEYGKVARKPANSALKKVVEGASVWYRSADHITDAGKEDRDKVRSIVEEAIKDAKMIEQHLTKYIHDLDTY